MQFSNESFGGVSDFCDDIPFGEPGTNSVVELLSCLFGWLVCRSWCEKRYRQRFRVRSPYKPWLPYI